MGLLDPTVFLTSGAIGAAIEVTVANIASPTELNARAAAQGDIILARTIEAGTGTQTWYYADTTSDAQSLPYIVSSATAGVKFIAFGGRYQNENINTAALTASRVVATDASKNLDTPATITTAQAWAFTSTVTVIDSSFSIIGSGDATKTIKFETDAQSAGADLTIDAGAQTADRTATFPVLTGNSILALSNATLTATRVPFATTNGILTDAAAFNYASGSGTLNSTVFTASDSINALGASSSAVISAGGDAIASDRAFDLNTAAGNTRSYRVRSAGTLRWAWGVNGTAETGSAAGSNWFLNAYNDAGTLIDQPIFIQRVAAGLMLLARPVSGASSILSTSPTAGIGYSSGAGGTVAQGSGSGKATTVVLNTVCGTITMDGATLNADTSVAFTFTNSAIANTDCVKVQHNSVGTLGAYNCCVTPGSGTATVTVRNVTPGNLSEAIVLRFVVVKAVTA